MKTDAIKRLLSAAMNCAVQLGVESTSTVAAADSELAVIRKENAVMIERLKKIQYQPDECGDLICVGCYRMKEEGCDTDCWICAALASKEADEKELMMPPD